jgi:hypothetical protein
MFPWLVLGVIGLLALAANASASPSPAPAAVSYINSPAGLAWKPLEPGFINSIGGKEPLPKEQAQNLRNGQQVLVTLAPDSRATWLALIGTIYSVTPTSYLIHFTSVIAGGTDKEAPATSQLPYLPANVSVPKTYVYNVA